MCFKIMSVDFVFKEFCNPLALSQVRLINFFRFFCECTFLDVRAKKLLANVLHLRRH